MEAKCKMSDEELIEKSFEWVKKLADTGGQAWTLKVPVDFNNDPDILFVELGNRLKQLNEIASKMNTELLAAVQSMSVDGKNKLVAIWMTKERYLKFRTIKTLFYLDDKWNEVYQEYRIKEGFSAAQLKANTYILSLVYGS